MSIDQATRERKSMQLLDEFPWEIGATIIGGYSVLGYGTVRYSSDLDIVVPKDSSKDIIRWFTNKSFLVEKTAIPNPQNYDGGYVRYRKEEVTVDVLVGAVRDREAQVDIPEKWISRDQKMQKIVGLNAATLIEVPLVRLEALWALKLQAGRTQDISDLYSVFIRKFSHEEVVELFRELKCETLTTKLEKTKKKLRNPGTYQDVRSSLQFKNSEKHQREWERFNLTVESIIDRSCR